MNGLELLRTIRKEYPDIIGMIFTGYLDDPELQIALEDEEIFKLIPKRWKLVESIEALVERAIDKYNRRSKCNITRC